MRFFSTYKYGTGGASKEVESDDFEENENNFQFSLNKEEYI